MVSEERLSLWLSLTMDIRLLKPHPPPELVIAVLWKRHLPFHPLIIIL